MDKILVVPDVHGRMFWKKVIDSNLLVIFLGDYTDPYGYEGISKTQVINNFKEVIDVTPANAATNQVQFATKQDIQELRDMMGSLESKFGNLNTRIDSMKGGQQHEQPVQSAQYSSVPATVSY